MEAIRASVSKEGTKMLSKEGLSSDIQGRFFPLFKSRINKIGVRSFFVKTLYQYILAQEKLENLTIECLPEILFTKQLPLLAEGIIAVQYYENQILDGKAGLRDLTGHWNKSKIDSNLLGGVYLKDCLFDFIETEMFPRKEDWEKGRMVSQRVRRIFKYVTLAQDMQDHHGTTTAYERGIERYVSISPEVDVFVNKALLNRFWKSLKATGIGEQHEWFVRNYLLRMALSSGALFAIMAEIVMDLLGYYGSEREKLLEWAMSIGILGQLVNDNNDYVLPQADMPTVSKIPEDAFADLRNNNLTLPLIYFLGKAPKEDFDKIKAMETNNDIFLVLFASLDWSIKAVQFIKNEISAWKFLNPQNPVAYLLEDMASVADVENNRFYRATYQANQPKTANVSQNLDI